MTGTVDINTGKGADRIDVNNINNQTLTIDAGDGDDTIDLNDSVTSAATVTGGAGNDVVRLSSNGTLGNNARATVIIEDVSDSANTISGSGNQGFNTDYDEISGFQALESVAATDTNRSSSSLDATKLLLDKLDMTEAGLSSTSTAVTRLETDTTDTTVDLGSTDVVFFYGSNINNESDLVSYFNANTARSNVGNEVELFIVAELEDNKFGIFEWIDTNNDAQMSEGDSIVLFAEVSTGVITGVDSSAAAVTGTGDLTIADFV